MTYDQAVALWPWALGAFALTCLAVGYWAGSIRTFYSLDHHDQTAIDVLRTLMPWAGNKRNRQYRL